MAGSRKAVAYARHRHGGEACGWQKPVVSYILPKIGLSVTLLGPPILMDCKEGISVPRLKKSANRWSNGE